MVSFSLIWKWTSRPSEGNPGEEKIRSTPHRLSWTSFPLAKMAIIIAVTIYGSLFFYVTQLQAPSGLSELGLSSPAERGFLTSIAAIGVPLGTALYSKVGAKSRIARLLLAEFALLSLGFMLMAKAGTVAGFLAGCFIAQFGAGMLLPTLLVWSMSILTHEFRGRGIGFWQSAFAFGQFLSPVVVTLAGKLSGGLAGAFGILSAGALAGAMIALTGVRSSKTTGTSKDRIVAHG